MVSHNRPGKGDAKYGVHSKATRQRGSTGATSDAYTTALLTVSLVGACDGQVIAAEGEQKAARALKEASDVISESSLALQLRYLQTLNTISAEKNSTIIFPMPIEFLNCAVQSQRAAD